MMLRLSLFIGTVCALAHAQSYTNDDALSATQLSSGWLQCGSKARGDACTWSNGRTGTCVGAHCFECQSTGPQNAECGAKMFTSASCVGCQYPAPGFGASYMCIPLNVGGACTYNSVTGTCSASGACENSVQNDPVYQGFDGKIRHCDEVGDFELLKDGSGRKIGVTFSGARVEVGGVDEEPQDKSWTTAVRFTSPNGDTVSCSLPGIQPNTSMVTMKAAPAGSGTQELLLTSQHPSVEFEGMTASAVLSWKEYAGVQYSYVVGCKVTTPVYTVTVYQVSGWEEAQARSAEHGWAAPFTWLNLSLKVTGRLQAPVTGILGDTYPKDLPPITQQEVSLGEGEVSGDVSLDGEPVEAKPAPPAKRRGRMVSSAPNSDGVFTAHLGFGGDLW